MMAAVYGDYIVRYSLIVRVEPEVFFMQCASLFTSGAQIGRLPLRAEQDDLLKDFDAGSPYAEKMRFLRNLAQYWRPAVGGKYLAYGQLLRPITFSEPERMPVVSTSASAYKKYHDGDIVMPGLVSAVFRAPDGALGVFLVNVTRKPIAFSFEMTPDRYPVLKSGRVALTRVSETGERRKAETLRDGKVSYRGDVGPRNVLLLEAVPDPKSR